MASIQQMIESDDERRMGSSSLDIAIGRGQVPLDDMSFTYPGAAVHSLSDINLKIEPGERLAMVGRVASGKSTPGRLLCGLHAPTSGSLSGDGLDSQIRRAARGERGGR